MKQASRKVNRESQRKEILFILPLVSDCDEGVEWWNGRGAEIGRQERGTRALLEAFFCIDSGSIPSPSASRSTRLRGLDYKIFALVMRPWLSNGGGGWQPCRKERIRTANRRALSFSLPSNTFEYRANLYRSHRSPRWQTSMGLFFTNAAKM